MAKVHPLIPNPKVRWNLANFMTYRDKWQDWGGLYKLQNDSPAFDPTNSEILDKLLLLRPRNTYTVTDAIYRPDLISYDIYGRTEYWQFLLFYNGISKVSELVAGTKIRYPALRDMEDVLLTTNKPTASELATDVLTIQSSLPVTYGSVKYGVNEVQYGDYTYTGVHYSLSTGALVKKS